MNLLRKARLIDKVSVNEVLLELSKVYEIHLGKKRKLSKIPNKVLKLAESLEMNIFPKKLRSQGIDLSCTINQISNKRYPSPCHRHNPFLLHMLLYLYAALIAPE